MDNSASVDTDARLLLIGDPLQAEAAYPKLRYASEELASIRRYFSDIRQHSGGEATPSSYRRSASKGVSVIHFAAHAEANHASPLDSAIILSPENNRYKLYSRDVAQMPISADIVTLSACRGAGARAYSGEGLVGFSWAFLDAGAKNVVAGLWDVSDRSTAKLMDRLYRGIVRQGLDPVEALRQAKLSLLHAGEPESKPWYWGPFQVYTRVWRPTTRLQAGR
jgi:CHAT domain-containing protein